MRPGATFNAVLFVKTNIDMLKLFKDCFSMGHFRHKISLWPLIYFPVFLFAAFGFAQNQYTLSGTVYETEGQETPLSQYFPCAQYRNHHQWIWFLFSYMEANLWSCGQLYWYDSQTETIELKENITQNLTLARPDNLDEVVLETNVERVNIKSPQMSVNLLNTNSIKQIRWFLAKPMSSPSYPWRF